MDHVKRHMDAVLSRVNTTVSEKQSTPESKDVSVVCSVCSRTYRRAFTEEQIARYKPEWDKQPCSDKCNKVKVDEEIARREKVMQQRVVDQIKRIIPKKYITIESDMKDSNHLMDKSLFIHGGVGVGKTVLMATLAKKYIRRQEEVKWI